MGMDSFMANRKAETMNAESRTKREWQDAVDAAHGALALDAARQYGLVTGGPAVHVERCQQILTRGKARGIMPAPDATERFVYELRTGESC